MGSVSYSSNSRIISACLHLHTHMSAVLSRLSFRITSTPRSSKSRNDSLITILGLSIGVTLFPITASRRYLPGCHYECHPSIVSLKSGGGLLPQQPNKVCIALRSFRLTPSRIVIVEFLTHCVFSGPVSVPNCRNDLNNCELW